MFDFLINIMSILISFLLGLWTSSYFWKKAEKNRKNKNSYQKTNSIEMAENEFFLNVFDTEKVLEKIFNTSTKTTHIFYSVIDLADAAENKTFRNLAWKNLNFSLIYFRYKITNEPMSMLDLNYSDVIKINTKEKAIKEIKINNIKIRLINNFIHQFHNLQIKNEFNKKKFSTFFVQRKYQKAICKLLEKDMVDKIFTSEINSKIYKKIIKFEKSKKTQIQKIYQQSKFNNESRYFDEEVFISNYINKFLQEDKFLSTIIFKYFKIKLKESSRIDFIKFNKKGKIVMN